MIDQITKNRLLSFIEDVRPQAERMSLELGGTDESTYPLADEIYKIEDALDELEELLSVE